VRILICDRESKKGGFFKTIKPSEIAKKKDAQEKVKQVIAKLQKFNVWVEAAVEVKKNGAFVIRDTEVKELWTRKSDNIWYP